MNPSRQCLARKRLPDFIPPDIGDLTEGVQQAEGIENGSVNADAYRGIPPLHPLQCRPGGKSSIRDNRHGKTTAAAGIMDVRPEFSQDAPHGGSGLMRSRHSLYPW